MILRFTYHVGTSAHAPAIIGATSGRTDMIRGSTFEAVVSVIAGAGGGGMPPLGPGPVDEITTANAAGTALARSGFTVAALLALARNRATHTGTQLAATISDFAAAVGSLLTWSAISGKPAAFPPETHAASHSAGGSDPITPASIGAEATANKGAAGGYASLDGAGQIPAAQIPSIAITEYLGPVASESAMLALVGQRGDWCTRTDSGTVWIITGVDPSVIAGWTEASYPAAPVSSVASRTGAVTLTSSDLTDRTSTGAAVFTAASAAEARGAIGAEVAGSAASAVAAHLITPEPHPEYARIDRTFPEAVGVTDVFTYHLDGLSDAPGAELTYSEWIAPGVAPGQDDALNRVYAQGYRNLVHPLGALSSWRAHEPAYQVGPNGHYWGELHDVEIITRNGTRIRLFSMTWDYGPNSHSGLLLGSLAMFRHHEVWFAHPDTGAVGAKVSGIDGSATFLEGWASLVKQGTRREIYLGPPGAQWLVAGQDAATPDVFESGLFALTWSSLSISSVAQTLSMQRFQVLLPDTNTVGALDGMHPTHRLRITDVHGTIYGGLRNDGSLSVPELLDIDAEPNSLYRAASGGLRFKRLDGGVDRLSVPDLVSRTLNVSAVAYGYAEIVLPAVGVTPADRVVAHLGGSLDAENDIEAINDLNLRVFAVPEIDQIRFVLTGAGPFVGPFPITYQVYP